MLGAPRTEDNDVHAQRPLGVGAYCSLRDPLAPSGQVPGRVVDLVLDWAHWAGYTQGVAFDSVKSPL